MHLIALVESPDHVCCRYRVSAFRELLAQQGHTLECRSLPRSMLGRICIGADLIHADAVILQRRLLPAWQRRLLRRSVRRLIFDYDDAVFHRDSYSPRGIHSVRRWRSFQRMLRRCDAVVAGNDWLRDRAIAAGAHCPVTAIPTCVDPGQYPRSTHKSADGNVRLVWVGSSSTLPALAHLASSLDAIGEERTDLRLRMICDQFFKLPHLPVEECAWDPVTEALAIAGCDIGVSWMPDDDWSRGKCGLKVLQYMAAGLPVIANPVGVHSDLIRHGETGFLAETESEWLEALRRLAGDADLRRSMGAAGRIVAERRYSVAAGARLWAEVLDGLLRRERAA